MTSQPLYNEFKVKELPPGQYRFSDSVYYVKADGAEKIQVFVTDANGNAFPVALSDAEIAAILTGYYTSQQTNALLAVKADLVGGKIPSDQLPSYVDDILEYSTFSALPATGETGKIYVVTDTNKEFRWSGSTYIQVSKSPVDSVAGRTGNVVLTKSDVGLSNVDNTADSAKPVSTAQAAADAAVQAYAIQRANHAGTQAASTITGLSSVATSGLWSDLVSRPNLIAIAAATILGLGAGAALGAGTGNTLIGGNAGAALIGGGDNTVLGGDCLVTTQTAAGNIAVGRRVLYNLGNAVAQSGTVDTCSFNIGIGWRTLEALTQGYENILLGNNSGLIATTAFMTTGMGSECLRFLQTGNQCNAFGVSALANVTTGNGNTGVGGGTGGDANGLSIAQCAPVLLGGGGLGFAIRTGNYNSFFGHGAASAVLEPDYMTVIGAGAKGNRGSTVFLGRLQDTVSIAYGQGTALLNLGGQTSATTPQINFNATGSLNVPPLANAIAGDVWYTTGSGKHLIYQITAGLDYQAYLTGVRTLGPSGFNGTYDLFVGKNVGNATMGGTTAQGVGNLLFGINVGTSITTASSNLFIGSGNVLTGNSNIVIAQGNTCNNMTTATLNLVMGNSVCTAMTTADHNIVIGAYNTATIMTGAFNSTVVGMAAANSWTTGWGNGLFGYGVAPNLSTGSVNTVIGGYNAGGGLSTGNYNTIIGNASGLSGSLSNTIVIADGQNNQRIIADSTSVRVNVAFKGPSVTVASLPSASTVGLNGQHFATNGRRMFEGAGSGSGIPVWSDGTNWRTYYDNSVVAA